MPVIKELMLVVIIETVIEGMKPVLWLVHPPNSNAPFEYEVVVLENYLIGPNILSSNKKIIQIFYFCTETPLTRIFGSNSKTEQLIAPKARWQAPEHLVLVNYLIGPNILNSNKKIIQIFYFCTETPLTHIFGSNSGEG